MGELSESLKNVSLGSILVVVGVISILTLVTYWYVFSEDPVIPYVTAEQSPSRGVAKPVPVPSAPEAAEAVNEPDDRVVIVETPNSSGGVSSSADINKTKETRTTPNLSPASNPADGSISVQAGAFSKLKGAEQLASQLKSKGFPSSISSSGGMYKVLVGAYSSRKQAEETAARLKAAGFSGYVRSRP